MGCEVEYTDEFGEWWAACSEDLQVEIASVVALLESEGPTLGFPRSSAVVGSKHSHMRELRIQYRGNPYRVLYAFNPNRVALLLIGGNKKGVDRWYETFIPMADKLYDDHVIEVAQEDEKRKGESHG